MAVEPRRSVHRTQWAAQFAVASELCKAGYEVAFTMGNHPKKDLLVVSPKGRSFAVDVKGLYTRNWWTISPRHGNGDLFYVFAYVPDRAANRFFILTQDQVNSEIYAASVAAIERSRAKGLTSNFDKFPGIAWQKAAQYEGRWDILPDWPYLP